MKLCFNCAGEKLTCNYARIVVFLALVLAQSNTASLTSILTISRLRPKLLSHAKVRCDENAFMRRYIEEVLNYKNVSLISDGDQYLRAFEMGNISAAFIEIPYAKVFVNRYCRKFTIIGTTYRDYLRHQSSQVADVNASNESVSIKTVRVARYLMNAEIGSPWRSPSSDRVVPETEMC
ncbi:hypothetical protein RHSIM_Rhsim13G0184000 [Rhododendron simsii]|uniref:Solute-binding protein family 3/N-terminal domain-containing protein n=1 Tax=Rhododendron simsii TaxID=118357 RepID=A0A834L6N9_RHOSS|nr:hypothetical protein RHSIM_Rhsim13G0184000 [Rhododendron simsii]